MRRVAIVCDGKAWYVRSIACIEFDAERDEMIYRCDEPLLNDVTLGEAVDFVLGMMGDDS